MDFLKDFLKNVWANEPVRSALYTIVVAIVGSLLVKAGLDSSWTDVIAAALAGAFGVGVTEKLRAKVTPWQPAKS